ncbi:hypothetical protein [Pseudomonas sp. fls2-241-R2A-110]|jgi:hypothetical protein|uniref:hypothetical protein n=1 Tax=Pseudomonas sp. fls2-241-R2A-110 TaxID=3040311 RepID=UPI002556A318|nr:hypothetical protein [Pseudomonas sp. fls2-241-R2A-110]
MNEKYLWENSNAVSGTLTTVPLSEIGPLKAPAFRFITNRTLVVFSARQDIEPGKYHHVHIEFPFDIKNGRHDFTETSLIRPPLVALIWNYGNAFRPLLSRPGAGYIDIDFDSINGTLNAQFSFGFNGEITESTGQIKDGAGMEYLEPKP